jgi:hypothetical protein
MKLSPHRKLRSSQGLRSRILANHNREHLLRCSSKGVDLLPPAWQTLFAKSGSNLTGGDIRMSIQAHLTELEKRHRALEEEIAEAMMHPSVDALKIAELKRRKLQVKDEIARLKNAADPQVH